MYPVLNDATGLHFRVGFHPVEKPELKTIRNKRTLKPVAISVSCPELSVVDETSSSKRMFTAKLTSEQYKRLRNNILPDQVLVECESYGDFLCNIKLVQDI